MKEYIIKEHPDFPYEEPKPPELIRCKDCKHCTETGFYNGIRWNYCEWFRRVMTENDYCSNAEPKETEE